MSKTATNKRFIIILAAAVLLLCAAVWVNVRYGQHEVSPELADPTPEPSDRETMVNVYNDYFNAFRAERSEVRAKEIEYLRELINGSNVDAESIQDVQDRLLQLVGNMEKEFTIESRIRGKGFLDAAVTIMNDSASIVIDGESLSDEEVARILDIVITETGLSASAVKISLGG